jgi:hypothetical protein
MSEDKLSHEERIRLESLAIAHTDPRLVPTEQIIQTAAQFEDYIKNGSNTESSTKFENYIKKGRN